MPTADTPMPLPTPDPALPARPTPRWPFLFMLPLLFIVASIAWQSFQRNDPRENRARHLYLSCKYYAAKNNGRLPDTLEELVPNYYIEGGAEASLYDVSRWTLLEPAKSMEVARLENRPLLLEKAASRAGEPTIILVRGSGKLERVDPAKEFQVAN